MYEKHCYELLFLGFKVRKYVNSHLTNHLKYVLKFKCNLNIKEKHMHPFYETYYFY